MKIGDRLDPALCIIDLRARRRREAIEELLGQIASAQRLKPQAPVLEKILARESVMSTGIGHGIAIPHVLLDEVDRITIAFGRSEKGIDFDALDGNPVHLVFLIIAPKTEVQLYLKTLAHLARLSLHSEFCQKLIKAGSAEESIEIIRAEEAKIA